MYRYLVVPALLYHREYDTYPGRGRYRTVRYVPVSMEQKIITKTQRLHSCSIFSGIGFCKSRRDRREPSLARPAGVKRTQRQMNRKNKHQQKEQRKKKKDAHSCSLYPSRGYPGVQCSTKRTVRTFSRGKA